MKTTDELDLILKKTKPEDIESYIRDHKDKMIDTDKPFSAFIREKIRSAGLKQQDVFLDADIPEGYGYKLISGEKHTKIRDVILRICFASRLGIDDIQKALKLYGMAPLYSRFERDAVLIIAANTGMTDSRDICVFLTNHGMEPLRFVGTQE